MKVSPTNEFDPGIGGGGLSERPQVGPVKHRADSEMKMQNLSVMTDELQSKTRLYRDARSCNLVSASSLNPAI